MAQVWTFTIRRADNGEFEVNSIFVREEMSRRLTGYEKFKEELGPHKTLNIIPEFSKEETFALSGNNVQFSFCKNGMVIALHCIATF